MNGSITIGGLYQETGYRLNLKMRVRQPATLRELFISQTSCFSCLIWLNNKQTPPLTERLCQFLHIMSHAALGTTGDPGLLSVSSTRGKGYGAYVQFKAMGKATCDSAGIGQSPSKGMSHQHCHKSVYQHFLSHIKVACNHLTLMQPARLYICLHCFLLAASPVT